MHSYGLHVAHESIAGHGVAFHFWMSPVLLASLFASAKKGGQVHLDNSIVCGPIHFSSTGMVLPLAESGDLLGPR